MVNTQYFALTGQRKLHYVFLSQKIFISFKTRIFASFNIKNVEVRVFTRSPKSKNYKHEPKNVFGIEFRNIIGLAAGLDKNGDYIDALGLLGFGFLEIGTVTPKPQKGNPKPRLFRYPKEEAIINRMGFNNKGADYVEKNLKKIKYKGILGINLGKNSDTPIEYAVADYINGFNKFAPYASYIAINISSPNTKDLRNLQKDLLLIELLKALKEAQRNFCIQQNKYVPLIIKISPDQTNAELEFMAEKFLEMKIDGVIATNTTTDRVGISSKETGGLSGKPITQKSTEVIRQLAFLLQNKIPIIASGGVMSLTDVNEKIKGGASLVQVYTGLIFRGPSLLKELSSL